MSLSSVSEAEDTSTGRPAHLHPRRQRHDSRSNAKKQWKAAAMMAKGLRDPWAKVGFDDFEEESVTRHMYNPQKCKWKTDEIVVKIESKVWLQFSFCTTTIFKNNTITVVCPWCHERMLQNVSMQFFSVCPQLLSSIQPPKSQQF